MKYEALRALALCLQPAGPTAAHLYAKGGRLFEADGGIRAVVVFLRFVVRRGAHTHSKYMDSKFHPDSEIEGYHIGFLTAKQVYLSDDELKLLQVTFPQVELKKPSFKSWYF